MIKKYLLALFLALLSVSAFGQVSVTQFPGPGVKAYAAGGETLVYGPDAFTAANGTLLQTYNAQWVKIVTNGDLEIQSNALSAQSLQDAVVYGWNGATVTNGRVVCNIYTGTNNAQFPGLVVRATGTSVSNAVYYLAEWDNSANDIILYRVTAGGTFTSIASGGSVAQNTTYNNAYLKVTGTNPVQLEAGDDTNGAAAVTFSDSAGNRITTGNVGLSEYSDTNRSATFDLCAIYTIP